MIYAIIDASGMIVNRVVVDDIKTWMPPHEFAAIAETAGPLQIGGTYINGIYDAPPAPHSPPAGPLTVLSQDLIAQFTAADIALIRIATDNEAAQAKLDADALKTPSAPLNQLWAALQTQKDPMRVTSPRFKAGWSALVAVLGQSRMAAIAGALGVTVTL